MIMKLIRFAMACVVATVCALSCTSCAGSDSKGDVAEIESSAGCRVYKVGDYDKLIAVAVDVYVTVAPADHHVRVLAPADDIDGVEVSCKDGILGIVDKNDNIDNTPRARPTVYLTAEAFSEIYAIGGAKVIFDKHIDTAATEIYSIDGEVTVP